MNRIQTPIALGLLLTGLTSCESPTLFRDNTITLSPLGDSTATRSTARPYRPAGTTAAYDRTTTVYTPEQPKLMIFDVNDLLIANPNFVAPEMDVFGSGGQPEYPEPLEPQAFIDEGTLIDTLRAALPEDLLHEDSDIRIVGGRLFITRPEK